MKNVLKIIKKPLINAIVGMLLFAMPFFIHINLYIDMFLVIISYAGLIYAAFTAFFYLLEEFTQYKDHKKHLKISNIASGCTAMIMIILFSFPSLLPNYTGNESGYVKEHTIYVTTNHECDYCEISKETRKRAVFLYNITHDKNVQVVDVSNDTNLGRSLNTKVKIFGSIVKVKHNEVKQIPYSRGTSDKKPLKTPTSYIYKSIYDIEKS
jgi:hypothetical protein